MKDVTCPCCGYITLSNVGEYNVCLICYWEDDPVQRNNPDYDSGTNKFILRQAQKNYMEYGVSDYDMKRHVFKADKHDIKDPNWKPF
ncbi:hypothetical protein IM792_03770 [Mucilaginibacter sp. JRF]|nr:hypothetical protein [Mucilaginibacter sp. JRF]